MTSSSPRRGSSSTSGCAAPAVRAAPAARSPRARTYDRRPERRWRHLDLGGRRCWLRMPLRRLVCPDHGVVTEAMPIRADAQRVHLSLRTRAGRCSSVPSA
ncbi:MAG TPA: transposase family protein [Candidatus Limnocylindria bacterium]|nr:transposase family protein [Candidatus Limnocylindria bacterium]